MWFLFVWQGLGLVVVVVPFLLMALVVIIDGAVDLPTWFGHNIGLVLACVLAAAAWVIMLIVRHTEGQPPLRVRNSESCRLHCRSDARTSFGAVRLGAR